MPQDSSRTIETPVLIVGGGPVGLALAADLGWPGTPCLVIEQGDGPADHPRATAINARSMEFMRRWGVADAVRNASAPEDFPHTALYCTTLSGFEIARIDRPHHGGRGATNRRSVRPPLSMARAAAPTFSPSCGVTSTIAGPPSRASRVESEPAIGRRSNAEAQLSPAPVERRGS